MHESISCIWTIAFLVVTQSRSRIKFYDLIACNTFIIWLPHFSLYCFLFILFYFYCSISSHLLDQQQQQSSFDPKSHPSKFITAHLKWKMNTWFVLSADTLEIKANLCEYMNTEWMVAMRNLGKQPMATSFTIQGDTCLLHACAVLCVFTM